jgi:hypothetical protein
VIVVQPREDAYEHYKSDELSIVISSGSHVLPACAVAEHKQQITMISITKATESLDSFSCIFNTCSDPESFEIQITLT